MYFYSHSTDKTVNAQESSVSSLKVIELIKSKTLSETEHHINFRAVKRKFIIENYLAWYLGMQEMLVAHSSSPSTHSAHRTVLVHFVSHPLNKLTLCDFSVGDCAKHWEALPSKTETEI